MSWTVGSATSTDTKAPAAPSGGSGQKKSSWTPIPDNTVLDAKLVNIERKFMQRKDGSHVLDDNQKPIEKVHFKFEITDNGPFNGRAVEGRTSTSFVAHPDCKAYTWVQGLLGRDLAEGESIDPPSLIGADCRVHVSAKELPRRDGTGTWVFNEVKDVLALKSWQGTVEDYPAVSEDPF